jgi:hypothetical protein
MFVGTLLVPVVALKLFSTGYRFLRYYGGSVPYRLKGPPHVLLRLLAPVLVAATTVLFGTGIALMVLGPHHSGPFRGLHTASFVVWIGVAAAHVLAHTPRAARALAAEWRERVPGAVARYGTVGVAIVAGLALALETSPLDDRWLV